MLYITVHLFGKSGIRGEFRDYEAKALAIFRKHGGEVVIAYVPVAGGVGNVGTGGAAAPDEIQILKIPIQTI